MGKKLAGVILVLSLLCACGQDNLTRTSDTFLSLDTVVEITVYGQSEEENRAHLAGAKELCVETEKLLSRTLEDSDIYRFNETAYRADVDSVTAEVVETGLQYSELSDGIFDITIAPVSSLWEFQEASGTLPDRGTIAEGLAHVDWRQVFVSGNTVYKTDPQTALDLGGIAKGYIADALGDYLREQGVEHALINLGGNILAVGERPDGPWRVGLEKPFTQTGEMVGTVRLSGASVVTSGVGQRYFYRDDVLYHHLLDTQTGYPVNNGLHAVSVFSETSTQAEALSTICFLLGREKGMTLLEETSGVEGMFLTEDGGVYFTSGAEEIYQFQPE